MDVKDYVSPLKETEYTLECYNSIINKFSKVSASDWWNNALAMDDEKFDKLLLLLPNANNLNKEEFIQMVQTKYKNLIISSSQESKLKQQEDKAVIMDMLSANSGLYRFLRGKGKSRHNDQDFHEYVLFNIWQDNYVYLIDVFSNSERISNESKILSNTLFKQLEKTSYDDGSLYNSLLNSSPIIDKNAIDGVTQKYLETDLEGQIAAIKDLDDPKLSERFGDLKDNDMLNNLTLSMVNYSKNVFCDVFSHFSTIFACLNTDLLGFNSLEFVDMLKGHPFSKSLQDKYDRYCAEHPGLTRNYEFANIIHKILKSEDFDWKAPKSSSCFNLPWHRFKVQVLYDSIIGKYIDRDTDVRAFCYFLTGHKPVSPNYNDEIVWIGKEKQSAAFFLGELKKRDTRGSELKWNKLPTLIWRDSELIFHSSTQYNQALRSKKFAQIAKVIEEAENNDYTATVLSENEK